jgi:hypothetical protein
MQKERMVFQICGAMFVFFMVMVLQGCVTVKCPCPSDDSACAQGDAPCAKHISRAGETTEGGGNNCTKDVGTVCNLNGSACASSGANGTCHTRWVNNKCQCMCELP